MASACRAAGLSNSSVHQAGGRKTAQQSQAAREGTGCVSEFRAGRAGGFQHDIGDDARIVGSREHLLQPLGHGRANLAVLVELESGSSKFASNCVFVYAGSMTETRMPLVRSSWSSDSE